MANGPPTFSWDGGIDSARRMEALAIYYLLSSIDAGPNGTGAAVSSAQNSATNGYLIQAANTWFSVVAASGAAVLPATSTPQSLNGAVLFVTNTSGTPVTCFPNPGDPGGTINNSATLSINGSVMLQCFTPGQWFAFSLGAGSLSNNPGGSSGQVQFNNGGLSFGGYTNAQLTALIQLFSPTLSGAVPASGGSSTSYLCANGTWSIPAGLSPSSTGFLYKTANYTALNGDYVAADTSGGAFTVTLPASPAAGNSVVIADAASTFNTSNLTVARNGSNIANAAANLTLNLSSKVYWLIYTANATLGWNVYGFSQ